MNRVAVVKSASNCAREGLRRALDAIGYAPEREEIFIKPNLVRPFVPNRGVTTHPAIVEAFVELFPDRKFVVGDGTPAPKDYEKILRVTGFRALARRHRNVRLVSLDEEPREKIGDCELPSLLRTHEYINIAKMKTHSQTYVSLSVKNNKGLLALKDKMAFHRRGLHGPVEQMGEAIRPALNIVEGFVALEGNGPSFFGKPRRADALVAGREAFAVDAVCCKIMGLDIRKAAHLRPDAQYEIVGDGVEAVRTQFLPPNDNWSIGRIRIHFDEHCCSVCLSNLPSLKSKLLRRPLKLAKLLKYAIKGDLVLVGGGSVPSDIVGKRVIFLGECGRKCARAAGIDEEHTVAGGCPFDPDEFIKIL